MITEFDTLKIYESDLRCAVSDLMRRKKNKELHQVKINKLIKEIEELKDSIFYMREKLGLYNERGEVDMSRYIDIIGDVLKDDQE